MLCVKDQVCIKIPIKGHNSAANLQSIAGSSPNLDFVNINAYTEFGYILSIFSKDIELKRISDIKQGQ